MFLIERGLRRVAPLLRAAAESRDGRPLRVCTILYRIPLAEYFPEEVVWVEVSEDLKYPVYLYRWGGSAGVHKDSARHSSA